MRWTCVRRIAAPPQRVFAVVADPEEFQRAIPGGSTVEFLTPSRSGVGSRFRATRITKGKATAFEQEVMEMVPGRRIRLINETHGTVWDSLFTVEPDGNGTELTLRMDARSDRWIARVMSRLIARVVQRALEGDMDAEKPSCEAPPRAAAPPS
jgi:carbon monoxide dehydrogenase subunit G